MCVVTACSESNNTHSQIPFVIDSVNVLTKDQNQNLKRKLASNVKNVPVFIRIIDKLPEGENLELYSNQNFNKLGIEKDGRGALFVLVMNSKSFRVEIGRGLEGEIPDMLADDITKNAVKHFSKKDFYSGLDSSVNMIYSLSQKGKEK